MSGLGTVGWCRPVWVLPCFVEPCHAMPWPANLREQEQVSDCHEHCFWHSAERVSHRPRKEQAESPGSTVGSQLGIMVIRH